MHTACGCTHPNTSSSRNSPNRNSNDHVDNNHPNNHRSNNTNHSNIKKKRSRGCITTASAAATATATAVPSFGPSRDEGRGGGKAGPTAARRARSAAVASTRGGLRAVLVGDGGGCCCRDCRCRCGGYHPKRRRRIRTCVNGDPPRHPQHVEGRGTFNADPPSLRHHGSKKGGTAGGSNDDSRTSTSCRTDRSSGTTCRGTSTARRLDRGSAVARSTMRMIIMTTTMISFVLMSSRTAQSFTLRRTFLHNRLRSSMSSIRQPYHRRQYEEQQALASSSRSTMTPPSTTTTTALRMATNSRELRFFSSYYNSDNNIHKSKGAVFRGRNYDRNDAPNEANPKTNIHMKTDEEEDHFVARALSFATAASYAALQQAAAAAAGAANSPVPNGAGGAFFFRGGSSRSAAGSDRRASTGGGGAKSGRGIGGGGGFFAASSSAVLERRPTSNEAPSPLSMDPSSSTSSFFSSSASSPYRFFSSYSRTGNNDFQVDQNGDGESSKKVEGETERTSDDDGQRYFQDLHLPPISPSQEYSNGYYGNSLRLSEEEKSLFQMLRQVRRETNLSTTLRVAGGWVRDKLLATPDFQACHKTVLGGEGLAGNRLTSKFKPPGTVAGNAPRGSSGNPGPGTTSAAAQASLSPPSMGRQGTKILTVNPENDPTAAAPVDIDIALDDMLGREFADHLNEYLQMHGKESLSVGVVLKNPEKSKHLETATLKVGPFWIDFVNLRAEEYADSSSRIPDLMRIGSAQEDAYRRDLTINALFYNINTGHVEDYTGRGFDDLRRGIIATPLPPLTTLLDDPLRVLRSIRFAARLRFAMDEELQRAARDVRVRTALARKVSRERIGGEVDLMLRSPDPVGAIRLLSNLKLIHTVFPVHKYIQELDNNDDGTGKSAELNAAILSSKLFNQGLDLLSTAHDHLADCRLTPPLWCIKTKTVAIFDAHEARLTQDSEARRLLWYAAFFKPLHDYGKAQQQRRLANNIADPNDEVPNRSGGKVARRPLVVKLLVDDLKRPLRDAEAVERILKAADEFTRLLDSGCDVSSMMLLLSEIRVTYHPYERNSGEVVDGKDGDDAATEGPQGYLTCSMNGRNIDSTTEEDPVWEHAMEFRLLCSKVMQRIGPLWRAALFLAISEQLATLQRDDGVLEYVIDGDVLDESQEERRHGIVERFDAFATALQNVGLVGIWNEKPLLDGSAVKSLLPSIPRGPAFRDVMDEQRTYMTLHPGNHLDALKDHLISTFPDFAKPQPAKKHKKAKKTQQEPSIVGKVAEPRALADDGIERKVKKKKETAQGREPIVKGKQASTSPTASLSSGKTAKRKEDIRSPEIS